MYGVFVNGHRPATKKAIREAIADEPTSVGLDDTSLVGDGDIQNLSTAPVGTYVFVGPDPFRTRKFYGSIVISDAAEGRTYRVK